PLRHTVVLNIESEKFTPSSTSSLDEASQDNTITWRETEVKSGDSLSTIFSRMNASATELYRIMHSSTKAEGLKSIYPGHTLRFGFDADDKLMALQYIPSRLERLEFLRNDENSYLVEHVFKQPDIQIVYRQAVIQDSLYLAGQDADIPDGLIMQVTNIFSGVLDFVYDPRKGDSFDIMYEEQYLDGEKIGNGNILVASYTNQGNVYQAYRYESENGKSGYFNEKGLSMRKAFLRAPLDFARISSGFNLRRYHPVHKKIKAHRGTDYSAPRGTPVFAAGDGRVWKSGFSRANGNYVFIKHPGGYTTKYLHLHKRYVKSGQKVEQKEIIGTVGSTGYSTGPHLHYEFLVNGVHRNPRTILNKLPTAKPVPKAERARFNEQLVLLKRQYEHKLASDNQ
ncbi:MAG: peptidoglycan DD-metalloendopeptidase family protein, partial [Sinobacterium sp.]|nr:peptidoglycan DD-metalloendopeptidase family protein [Sinobacterium sp.]